MVATTAHSLAFIEEEKCTRNDPECSHLLADIKLSTNISQIFSNNQQTAPTLETKTRWKIFHPAAALFVNFVSLKL
jgi:lipopolysaccharide export LptBFGC system permease protein LptF